MKFVKLNYATLGFLIGLAFPVFATYIQIASEYRTISIHDILAVQKNCPLLWIIDSAPLVISILTYAIGAKVDIANLQKDEISLMSIIAKRTLNGVVITDEHRKIIWANESFMQITQYTLDEMMGKVPGQLLQGPDSDPKAISQIRNALAKPEPIEVTLVNYKKDGSRYFNNIELIPVFNQKNKLTNFISLQRDVSKDILEIKGLKDGYDKIIESFKRLNKLTSYSIHNFRSPINNISAIIDLLADNTISADEQSDMLKSLKPLLIRADETISGIIKLSQNSETEADVENIDISKMINEIFESLLHLPKKEIIKNVKIYDFTQLNCNRYRLHSILENLITNSVKYHDPSKEKLQISIEVIISKDMCKISVEDNGIGIPAKVQGKVFEMFYRGTNKSHGSGLGLYIVKETVEQMNGTINLESTEYVGTTISFVIENKMQPSVQLNNESKTAH